jgi:hypothetical protein
VGCAKRGGQVQGVANYQGVQLSYGVHKGGFHPSVDVNHQYIHFYTLFYLHGQYLQCSGLQMGMENAHVKIPILNYLFRLAGDYRRR